MNSWIGGGLSSLKGQLSHLITEGTEENSDLSVEIEKSTKKISELENELRNFVNEITDLKERNNELQMKLQSEELLLGNVSESYQEKLKQKEEIIENLTNKISFFQGLSEGPQDGSFSNTQISNCEDHFTGEYVGHSNLLSNEISSLKSQINTLNQEIAKWKLSEQNQLLNFDQENSFDETVKILLEEQQREMELQHSNYVMELQHEHSKQINFLHHQIQQLEQSINDDDDNRNSFPDVVARDDKKDLEKPASHEISIQTSINDPNIDSALFWNVEYQGMTQDQIKSIIDIITTKINSKQATLESLIQKISDCEEAEFIKHSDITNCFPEIDGYIPDNMKLCRFSSDGMSDNQSSIKIPSQFKHPMPDSISQVSDISEVSIKSKMLDEHVRNLASQLTNYEKQFIYIEELTKTVDDMSSMENFNGNLKKIDSKINNLKSKLSERKLNISKQMNLPEFPEEERNSNVEESWENSSTNSLVEERINELQELSIEKHLDIEIIELYQSLFPNSPYNDNWDAIDILRHVLLSVGDLVKTNQVYLKLEQEVIAIYNEIQSGNGIDQLDILVITDTLKDSFRTMKETCSVHNYIQEENKSLQELLSQCQIKIASLDNEKSELIAKNTELDEQLIDLSITVARYEGLEKICDKYQKQLAAITKSEVPKPNLNMDSNDILEHVETFNQEKDECIQTLESKIISLQNLCEEKDDDISDLKQREMNIIFEYDSLIEVLKGELESVRATVEKNNENELLYKKQLQELQEAVLEKETMIKCLNEELTMLSVIDIENEAVSGPEKVYIDVLTQTHYDYEDIKINLENQIEYLALENQRLEKVLEAQASSLGQYEIKVTNLQAEISKLSCVSNTNQEALSDEDMTKETLHHLSQMIRDKEWEIEALKSKNSSLCEIIKKYNNDQSDSFNMDYIESVLNEKESLSKELNWYQENREQLISTLNLKHKESLNYHGEIQRLISYINTEQTKWNEVATENEQMKEQIKQIFILEKSLESYKQESPKKLPINLIDTGISFTNIPPSSSEQMILHAECQQCKDLKEKSTNLEEESRNKSAEIRVLQKHVEQISFELKQAQLQTVELTISRDRAQQQLEFCQNELTNHYRNNVPENPPDDSTKNIWNNEYHKGVIKDEKTIDDKAQLQLLIHQKQIECDNYISQIEQLRARESKLLKEKQIFQDHLIRIEDSYTQEATLAEDREQILRKQLRDIEDNLQVANDEISKLQKVIANIRNELNGELNEMRAERNEAQQQLKETQIQLIENMKSVGNLQSVLDKFQQEQNIEMLYQKERFQQELDRLIKERDSCQQISKRLQNEMDMQKDLVDAAQRLSDQIELKDDQLAELQALLSIKEELIDNLKMEIRKLNTFTESKVDKVLMKNLVIGYFHTPTHRRQEALKVIGSLLQFADSDYNRIGIDTANKSRWFSWLRSATAEKGSAGNDPEYSGKSFSELFITFLEKESSPMPQVKLPTNQIAAEARQHSSLSQSNEYPYTKSTSISSIIDHHKFFPSSPVLTKRNGSPSSDRIQTDDTQQPNPSSLLFIPNMTEVNPDSNQKELKSSSNHRRSESSRNLLLSLLDQ